MGRTLIAAAAASLLLAGCAAIDTPRDEGYELGDTTESLLRLQEQWCAQGNVLARGMLLMSVRAAVPGYPASGLCTDLFAVLDEATVNAD